MRFVNEVFENARIDSINGPEVIYRRSNFLMCYCYRQRAHLISMPTIEILLKVHVGIRSECASVIETR